MLRLNRHRNETAVGIDGHSVNHAVLVVKLLQRLLTLLCFLSTGSFKRILDNNVVVLLDVFLRVSKEHVQFSFRLLNGTVQRVHAKRLLGVTQLLNLKKLLAHVHSVEHVRLHVLFAKLVLTVSSVELNVLALVTGSQCDASLTVTNGPVFSSLSNKLTGTLVNQLVDSNAFGFSFLKNVRHAHFCTTSFQSAGLYRRSYLLGNQLNNRVLKLANTKRALLHCSDVSHPLAEDRVVNHVKDEVALLLYKLADVLVHRNRSQLLANNTCKGFLEDSLSTHQAVQLFLQCKVLLTNLAVSISTFRVHARQHVTQSLKRLQRSVHVSKQVSLFGLHLSATETNLCHLCQASSNASSRPQLSLRSFTNKVKLAANGLSFSHTNLLTSQAGSRNLELSVRKLTGLQLLRQRTPLLFKLFRNLSTCLLATLLLSSSNTFKAKGRNRSFFQQHINQLLSSLRLNAKQLANGTEQLVNQSAQFALLHLLASSTAQCSNHNLFLKLLSVISNVTIRASHFLPHFAVAQFGNQLLHNRVVVAKSLDKDVPELVCDSVALQQVGVNGDNGGAVLNPHLSVSAQVRVLLDTHRHASFSKPVLQDSNLFFGAASTSVRQARLVNRLVLWVASNLATHVSVKQVHVSHPLRNLSALFLCLCDSSSKSRPVYLNRVTVSFHLTPCKVLHFTIRRNRRGLNNKVFGPLFSLSPRQHHKHLRLVLTNCNTARTTSRVVLCSIQCLSVSIKLTSERQLRCVVNLVLQYCSQHVLPVVQASFMNSAITKSANFCSLGNVSVHLCRQDRSKAALACVETRTLCFVSSHCFNKQLTVTALVVDTLHCLLHFEQLHVIRNAGERKVVCVLTVAKLVRLGLHKNLAKHERHVLVGHNFVVTLKLALPLLEAVVSAVLRQRFYCTRVTLAHSAVHLSFRAHLKSGA